MKVYKNNEGTHGISPINGEYTLCGDAFDNDDSPEVGETTEVDGKRITCEKCRAVIKYCKEVK